MAHAATTNGDTERTRSPRTGVRALDDLARLTHAELVALYGEGAMPGGMQELDGDLTGRMLAVRGARGPLLGVLSSFARSRAFPWAGKSFASKDSKSGTGINRIALGGRHRLFPFRTRLGPSVVDGRPAVILDYDDPDNPRLIRAVHDEVRAIAPGLYFGPACWKGAKGKTTTVLWFALDARELPRDKSAS